MLNRENGTKESAPNKVVSDIFKSPIVIAIITGIILGVSGIYKMLIPSGIASVIDSCTDFFGAPTGAIILLTIGYDLVLSDVPWKKVAKTIAARVIIMARKISADCMQLHGGYGYMEEYKIARRYRDIAVTPIFAGSNEIMKVIIAKNLGL